MLPNLTRLPALTGIGLALSALFITLPALTQSTLSEASRITINGIGPIRVGMTLSEASTSAATQFEPVSSGGEEWGCYYYRPQGGPEGLTVMVTDGRISRIDVSSPGITTVSGAGVGDSERQIVALYPGQIEITPHEYVSGGHYLTFIPRDAADRNYRVIFETDGQTVTEYRSGRLPEVGWIEGCL